MAAAVRPGRDREQGPPAAVEARLEVRRHDGFLLDADVRAPAGQTTALLGPNGAGKSTAIAALCGLLPLDGGSILLDGMPVDDPGRGIFVAPEARDVGVVFQHGLLFDHLTVLDNVAFGPRSRGADRAEARRTARDWLARLGIEPLAARRPRQLSGGQAQLVALGRALATAPRLLLLDEPLAALDVSTRASLRRVLADHLDSFAGARLVVTHDPVDAFLLADLVHIIEAGRVTQVGTPAEIRLHPRTPYAADLAGANLLRGAARAGVVVVDGHELHVADREVTGPVLATVHPRAVALYLERPAGSPRNTWRTTINRTEDLGDRVRLELGAPLPLTVEVTPDAVRSLDLVPGAPVWATVKATEIRIEVDDAAMSYPR